MNTTRNIVPFAALASATTITLAELDKHGRLPTVNQWVAWAIVFFLLSALADIGAPIANGFAALVVVGILAARGEEALSFATSKTEPKRNSRRMRHREVETDRQEI